MSRTPSHLYPQQRWVDDEIARLIKHSVGRWHSLRAPHLLLDRQSAAEIDRVQSVNVRVAALQFLRRLK